MREYVRFSRNRMCNRCICTLLDICSLSLGILFAVILVFSYFFRVITVEGSSMMPTIREAEKLVIVPLDRRMQRGDVVVISADRAVLLDEQGQPYDAEGLHKCIVKRIIGVGGQVLDIDFEQNTVSIDGELLNEPYILGRTISPVQGAAFDYPVCIPEGYLFVMGDNREISLDSRYTEVGLVRESDVDGKVLVRCYPYAEFGPLS